MTVRDVKQERVSHHQFLKMNEASVNYYCFAPQGQTVLQTSKLPSGQIIAIPAKQGQLSAQSMRKYPNVTPGKMAIQTTMYIAQASHYHQKVRRVEVIIVGQFFFSHGNKQKIMTLCSCYYIYSFLQFFIYFAI